MRININYDNNDTNINGKDETNFYLIFNCLAKT